MENLGVIIDTDPGLDTDDFLALLLLLNSPELPRIDLIVTGDEVGAKRALLAKKIISLSGRSIPVTPGADLGNSTSWVCDELISDMSEQNWPDATESALSVIEQYETTIYIGLQGFTNLRECIEVKPDIIHKLKVYQMAGSIGFEKFPGWTEHNIRLDIPAARTVLRSGVDLTLVMAQTTMNPEYLLTPESPLLQKLREKDTPINRMLLENYEAFHMWLKNRGLAQPYPLLHDPLTVSAALGKDFIDFESMKISIDEQGRCYEDQNGALVKVSRAQSKTKNFMEFLVSRL